MELSISNIINISIGSFNTGVNAYNTSNLAIVTGESVIDAIQTLTFNGIAASGDFVLRFGTQDTNSIAWDAVKETIQNEINSLTGFENVIVTGSIADKKLTFTQMGNLGKILIPTFPTNTLQTAGSVDIAITPLNVSEGWSGGKLGYSIYISPTQVGKDFGTNSITFKQANAIFSQQPNILAGGGKLIVILRKISQQTIQFSDVPDGGDFVLQYNTHDTTSLLWNSTAEEIQTALRLIEGLENVIVTGSIANKILTVFFNGIYGNALPLSASDNTLVDGVDPVDLTFAITVAGETYGEVITRTQGLVNYFGVIPNENIAELGGQTGVLADAAIILPLNIIGAFVSNDSTDLQPGGIIDLLRSGTFNNCRGLYYGDDGSYFGADSPAIMMASYMGRALSVNFSGSNTTDTENLKQLAGVEPDPTMTQTIYELAKNCGADLYVSIGGDPCVISNGANKFFDQVYNLKWFVGGLQVAGFNFLAGAATKIPQTEDGMDGLKNAYKTICEQAKTNAYVAPGKWTSAETFGNQVLFFQNISQVGYYIFSLPLSQQLAVDRAARKAPLVQIAIKEAGAMHESSVIVYVNP